MSQLSCNYCTALFDLLEKNKSTINITNLATKLSTINKIMLRKTKSGQNAAAGCVCTVPGRALP